MFELGKDEPSVLMHGAYGLTGVAAVVAPVRTPRSENQAAGVGRAALVERRRPIESVRACAVEVTIPAVACGRKENRTAVLTRKLLPVHVVLSSPRRSAVV